MIPRSALRPGLRVRRVRRFQDDLVGTIVKVEDDRVFVRWDDEDDDRVTDIEGDAVPGWIEENEK